MNSEQKTLKELILERVESKGLNIDKIFQATEIPKHYLECMLKGEWIRLPAAPYTRGYFKKVAPILDWDGNEMWTLYQNETELLKTSGASDKLPENRFAIKRKNHVWAWPILAVFLIGIYGFLNIDRLLGTPELMIRNPLSASIVTSFPQFLIDGSANSRDTLFINNEEVLIEKDGQFQKNYELQIGLNTFEIVAKRFLGRETKVIKQIIYQNDQIQKGR